MRQARSAAEAKMEAPGPGIDDRERALNSHPEMAAELDAFPSLAPEPLPGGGERGEGLEAAGLLAWLNPQGGVDLTRPVEAERHVPTVDVAALVERWVRRVALGGDTRRGVAKLDIGQGRYAGAELCVVTEAGHVSVDLSLPLAAVGLAERLERRLNERGYTATVTVR